MLKLPDVSLLLIALLITFIIYIFTFIYYIFITVLTIQIGKAE